MIIRTPEKIAQDIEYPKINKEIVLCDINGIDVINNKKIIKSILKCNYEYNYNDFNNFNNLKENGDHYVKKIKDMNEIIKEGIETMETIEIKNTKNELNLQKILKKLNESRKIIDDNTKILHLNNIDEETITKGEIMFILEIFSRKISEKKIRYKNNKKFYRKI
mgnify:CR=1 FL=1